MMMPSDRPDDASTSPRFATRPPVYASSDSFDSINTLAPSRNASATTTTTDAPCLRNGSFSSTATTPAPSRPLSFIGSCEYDGPTRVGSPEPSYGGAKVDEFDDDVEKKGKSTKQVVEAQRSETGNARGEEEEYPEGGLRAYLALAGSTLVLTCTFSISNSFGTFLNYYKLHQLAAYDTSKISWIGSCHLFITFGSAFLAGVLFDKGLCVSFSLSL